MYLLENGIELTEEIKEAFRSGITRAYLKVVGTDTIINEENYLKDLTFEELRFVPDQGIIGQAVARRLTINFINENNLFDLEDKELELHIGAQYNGETYYINYGNFIVQHPENENTNDNTSFTALDYMIKFNEPYQDRVEYPCTMLELLEDVCLQAGVELGSTTFKNAAFEVENNQFVNNESLRQVLQAIAMSAFSWARIGQDNKLYLDFDMKIEPNETINIDQYYTLNFNSKNYGPITRIVMKDGQIEGENVTINEDGPLTEEYGIKELAIVDNPFAYTQDKKRELINVAESLYGFTYKPINNSEIIGYLYLGCTDLVQITDMQGETFISYVFNHIITYNGTSKDTIECPAMTETETKYTFTPTVPEAIKQVQIKVDKANAEIQSIVSEDGVLAQQSITLAGIETKVAGIPASIKELEDKTVRTEEYEAKIKSIETSIEQTKSEITFKFSQEAANELAKKVENNQKLLEEYIRFQGALIELGRVGNDFKAQLTNTELAFWQNNNKIAYISNNKLHITDAEIQNKLTIGKFAFIPRENGNLSFTWIGG